MILPNIRFTSLNHKILKIKSLAFMKIVFAVDQSDSEPSNSEQDQSFLHSKRTKRDTEQIIAVINKTMRKEILRHALNKIKLAGWKLILQVKSDEEEDSYHDSSFMSNNQTDENMSLNLVGSNLSIRKPMSNLQKNHKIYPFSLKEASPLSLIQKYNNQTTRYHEKSSTISNRQMAQQMLKFKKRKVIINKIKNVQLCLDYIMARSDQNGHGSRQTYLRY